MIAGGVATFGSTAADVRTRASPDTATLSLGLGSSAVVEPIPAGLEAPALVALWRKAKALEKQSLFLEIAEAYETLAARADGAAYPSWKASRSLWLYAENLPPDAKKQRLPYFERAKAQAAQGLARDPECAECMLWKFSAMGRIATTKGIVTAARFASEMQDLLLNGIALQPAHADNPHNTTLGNLHYAATVFYRVVPESLWLRWLIGVSGDLDKSLAMIREALAIAPDRIDYNVELGAVLSCYAERKNADWARQGARSTLEGVPALPFFMSQDALDVEHAKILLEKPEQACGSSRDGWIEVVELNRESAQREADGDSQHEF